VSDDTAAKAVMSLKEFLLLQTGKDVKATTWLLYMISHSQPTFSQ